MSANAFAMHDTVVADVHDDVKQLPRSPPPPRSSPAVAVCSPTPKLSPLTVNDAYPLCGEFEIIALTAELSNVNANGCAVPTMCPTLSCTVRTDLRPRC
jgi:hypothetical protein